MTQLPAPPCETVETTMETFTKGPWEVSTTEFNQDAKHRDGVCASVMAADGTFLADIWSDFEEEAMVPVEGLANARLMASSPALYAALQALVADLDEFDIRPADDVMKQARAALTLATKGDQ